MTLLLIPFLKTSAPVGRAYGSGERITVIAKRQVPEGDCIPRCGKVFIGRGVRSGSKECPRVNALEKRGGKVGRHQKPVDLEWLRHRI